MSKTLVLVKPDAVERGLVGAIIQRIEIAGFAIKAMRMLDDPHLVAQHYREHQGKYFFGDLVCSMAGPLIALIVEYKRRPELTVPNMRQLIGPYADRIVGTIRGDFALDDRRNSIHASDSSMSAKREISLWFSEGF